MKKLNKVLIITLISTLNYNLIYGQSSIGLKLGAANFIGGTINYNYCHYLNYLKDNSINLSVGLGYSPWGPSYIFNNSITYQHKRLGIGIDHSRFYNDFYFKSEGSNNFIDMLIYPNISYAIVKRRVNISISSGAYFAFGRYRTSDTDKSMSFLGDIIAGGGITMFYKL